MTTAQRLKMSIENFERKQRLIKAQEERDLARAIAASLEDMGATSHVRTSAPVAMQRPNAPRPQRKPVFHQQFEAAESALKNGHPTGNMCGALALAHMTGTAPQWPLLHEVAMNDLLKNIPAGRATDAQLKEAKKIVYEGVYIEHLQTMLAKNKVPFDTLSALDPDHIDQVFHDGKTKGVTYGYVRPGGTAHFAALRKDASGQWWDMDSYHQKPQKIDSPITFLKNKCASELRAGRGFDLIYTNA
ncbi:MAG: hypothetical protein GAK35_02491 [Herbaspirillum frisingense]|uniref:Uncharacterized protein n=1 Tax=Herbaspirillum frisingense TaxID=92645 RepID=A0A7V8JU64_9BURK|nr:MAG: hypothetical protein GAK35_02491 [Herbaspirillum frisingense]